MTHIQPIHHSQDAQGPEAALQAAGPPSGFSQHSCPELNGDPSQKTPSYHLLEYKRKALMPCFKVN